MTAPHCHEVSSRLPSGQVGHSLKDLQAAVGGLIEFVPSMSYPEVELIVDEESANRGHPYNSITSLVAGYPIFGEAIATPLNSLT